MWCLTCIAVRKKIWLENPRPDKFDCMPLHLTFQWDHSLTNSCPIRLSTQYLFYLVLRSLLDYCSGSHKETHILLYICKMGKTIDLKTKIPWYYAAGLPGAGPWDAMTPRHNLNGINLIKVSALATLNQVQCLKIVLVSYCLLSSTDSACLRISLQPAKVPIVLSDSGNLAQAQDDMSWTYMAA